ncbi:ABZJ_00895 family protein [Mesorhizobium sp. M1340]|uniref:ABZJ_00895 family protein n=1 Tax=unclassified Mesorhizobium TaxID=325217 RepID=UPI0033370A43
MPADKIEAVNIWRYVGIYISATIVLYVSWVSFVYLLPSVEKSTATAVNLAIIFASSSFSYSAFIKRHGRLFERSEYWKIVILSTAASLLFSIVCLLFSVLIGVAPTSLEDIPAGAWILVLAILALFGFCLNAIGFNKQLGKIFLKASRARRAQLDAEPFQ